MVALLFFEALFLFFEALFLFFEVLFLFFEALLRGGTAVDAVVAAVKNMEENPVFDAGIKIIP